MRKDVLQKYFVRVDLDFIDFRYYHKTGESTLFAFGTVGAGVITLLYHYKLKKHGRAFELYYAVGLVGIYLFALLLTWID
jgi:hypothetical protein